MLAGARFGARSASWRGAEDAVGAIQPWRRVWPSTFGSRLFLSCCCLIYALPRCSSGPACVTREAHLAVLAGGWHGFNGWERVEVYVNRYMHASTHPCKVRSSSMGRANGAMLGQPSRQWLEMAPCFALGQAVGRSTVDGSAREHACCIDTSGIYIGGWVPPSGHGR